MRVSKIKTLIIIVIFIISLSSAACAQDILSVLSDIEVGSYYIFEFKYIGRAQQGIAVYENQFYTSAGAAGVEEMLFRYHPKWGEPNLVDQEPVTFDNSWSISFTHLGDIDVYDNYIYGVFTDSLWDPLPHYLNLIYIAWFNADILDHQEGDYIDISWLLQEPVGANLYDISGLAFKDGWLYLLGYQAGSGRPRIFSTEMNGNVPRSDSFTVYDISTWYANGLVFKGDYVFISWGETDNTTTAYIDIYKYPLTHQASPIKTYQYEAEYTHAEGITFNGDELWVAQGTHVLQLDNPLPKAPTGVSASDGEYTDKVRVIWNTVSDANAYEIYRNTTDEPITATIIGTNYGSMNNVFDDDFVEVSTIYYYWVRATKDVGASENLISEFSNSDSGSTILSPSDTIPGDDFFIAGYYWDDSDGDKDLVMEAGETVQLEVRLHSNSNVKDVEAYLSTKDSDINIGQDYNYFFDMIAGEYKWSASRYQMDLNFTLTEPDIRLSDFNLFVTYLKEDKNHYQDLPFDKKFLWPGDHVDFEVLGYTIDDNTPTNHRNNGDNIFQSSEEVHIRPLLKLKDDSYIPQATSINATLLYIGTELAIPSNYYRTYADMIPGNSWYPENDRYFRIESKKWNFTGTVNLDVQVDWDQGGPIVLYDAIQITIAPAPIIQVEPEEYDFGTTPRGVDVTHTMLVENMGSGVMNVFDVSCIDNDTTVPPEDRAFTIKPGAYKEIKVTIDTDNIESKKTISREVVVTSDARINDMEPPSDRMVITGMVVTNPNNQAPVLQPIGDKSVDENVILTFTVNAIDPDGDPITYSAQNMPSGATFTNQTFSWTPSYNQAGSYDVTFIASDGNSQDSETITITVNNVNRAPVLGAISDQSVDENSLLSFSVSATDADGQTITYSISGLPAGAVFASQTFTWMPSYDQAGTYQVTFTAYDGQAQDSQTIKITVINVNRIPVLTSIGNKSAYADVLLTFTIDATDPDGDAITYSAQILPSGATFSNQDFNWIPRLSQMGSYDITFLASDGQLQDSKAITITVDIDSIAPNVTNCSPTAGSIQVPLNNLITLHITDAG